MKYTSPVITVLSTRVHIRRYLQSYPVPESMKSDESLNTLLHGKSSNKVCSLKSSMINYSVSAANNNLVPLSALLYTNMVLYRACRLATVTF